MTEYHCMHEGQEREWKLGALGARMEDNSVIYQFSRC